MTNPQKIQKEIQNLEEGLDSFDARIRKESLLGLLAMTEDGWIDLPAQKEIANLHCHSFYSYNGYGYSPTHLAWIGKKLGIAFMGIVDFDVLDGVDEFLGACEAAGIRGAAGIETRVHIPQFREAEINSPGEPGIAYHMGTGFISSKIPESVASAFLDIRQRAVQRNQQILNKVCKFLSPLSLDYEEDVLPLTPSGYATERHMIQKIAEKADETFDDPIGFWSKKLCLSMDEVERKIKDLNGFRNLLRNKLMKRGGVGYMQPDEESFPAADEFHQIILAADAIPCSAWLDGTSAGEQQIEALLNLLIEKGVAVINIIPDRNWNIADEAVKAIKLRELYRIVDLAETLDLPILVGTEMNSFGQKLVDDFEAPELAPVKEQFINGAYFIYGHTQMARLWGMGYQSDWAQQNLPDRKAKNDFYLAAGKTISPSLKLDQAEKLISQNFSPKIILERLKYQQKLK